MGDLVELIRDIPLSADDFRKEGVRLNVIRIAGRHDTEILI